MTIHISRDYAVATSGYPSNFVHAGYYYTLAIFLHKVLGYSIVGQNGFNLNSSNFQTSTISASTTIAGASNGQSLPQATINVASTTGFPASGQMWVATSDGFQIVKYSGTTGTTFTNCTGGTGTMTGGQTTTIAASSNGAVLPQATINVASTTGFPTTGTIYIITSTGPQAVTYTNTNATQFLGCSGGGGTMSTGGSVASASGNVSTGPNRVTSASGSTWTVNTTFPHGMSNGDYVNFAGTGSILPKDSPFAPFPVQVNSSTQLSLLTSVASGSYTANTEYIIPSAMLIASGTGASINFAGAPSVYAVQVPTTARTVVTGTAPDGDVNRILVLKSNLYPTKNSGLFKISTVNTATNSYTVNYRSSDTPPAETNMNWWLYEVENQAGFFMRMSDWNRNSYSITAASNTTPIQITFNPNTVADFNMPGAKVTITGVGGNTAANGTWTVTPTSATTLLLNNSSGNGTYTSGGTITKAGYTSISPTPYSKIILQSPHSTGWQLRISIEGYNATQPYATVAVGFGGNSFGDFPIGGVTTNLSNFLDFTLQGGAYSNMILGGSSSGQPHRMTWVGDDTGRAFFGYNRTQTTGNNGLIMFGLPDNEPTPLAPTINRAFFYGVAANAGGDYGTIQTRWGANFNAGLTFRDIQPEMCSLVGWADMNAATQSSPVYSTNAGDTPFTGTTEVLPWEIWGGVAIDIGLSLTSPVNGPNIFTLNQRFMGTAPFIRQGRTNFGTFTLSTDSTATSNISAASNTAPIQITTSATNALTTGQTVIISGVTGNTAANGTWVINVIDNTHFTLTGSVGNGSYLGGGTVQGTAHWLHLQNGIYLAWNGAGGLTP